MVVIDTHFSVCPHFPPHTPFPVVWAAKACGASMAEGKGILSGDEGKTRGGSLNNTNLLSDTVYSWKVFLLPAGQIPKLQ